MVIVLVILHVLVGFFLIGIVLLQSGKGADIGSAFGGAGSQAVFGSMGTPTLLGKITGAVAVMFVLTSFGLTMLSGSRSSSVVRPGPAPASQSTPAPATSVPPAPAPAARPSTPAVPAR
jgi:preprotein translocase subunit SecG